jgi:triacylglycerol esterase/lipase EstA (alpha/beta hydrolase family)
MALSAPFVQQRHADSMAHCLRQKGASVAQWLRLPGTAAAPECASIRYWDRPVTRRVSLDLAPVIFVHGYAGTEHIFRPLRSALTDAGFGCLVALRYNAFRTDIRQIADWLVQQAQRSMDVTGVPGVHLIGHSMGGLVVREAVQNRGLGGPARTAVTIATPHSGTKLARLVPGPAARQMRPGSAFLAGLTGDRPHGKTRWVAVHGGADRVVPEEAGVFGGRATEVIALRESSAGHGSIARHPEVVSQIVAELLKSEVVTAPVFSLAA